MINFPNKKQLKEIKSFNEPFCLTIYAPYLKPSMASNPNRIELKNLLKEADKALTSAGVKPQTVKKTLGPARELLDSGEFWPIHHESLVLFMHPKMFRYYHLPKTGIPYMLTVEKGYNTEPLEKIMKRNRKYFVLALGHKNVKLYEGDRYRLKPVSLRNFPSDLKETLRIDEYPKWRETHAIAPASYGKGSEAYHGQYNVAQTDKDMLLEFFRRIDQRLHPFFHRKNYPLVIAGVNHLLPIYRKANTYAGLIPSGISGNFEHVEPDDIREKAWQTIYHQKK